VNRIIQQRQWLYLLAALVLLMQSFSIWHDAQHAYHAESEQCERCEGFANNPALDTATHTLVITARQTGQFVPVQLISLLQAKQYKAYAIRGPPFFS
jgi:hypothetical protein